MSSRVMEVFGQYTPDMEFYSIDEAFANLYRHKYIKELEKLTKMELLILDDFGLQAFDTQDREALMDIIDDRHGKKSTIISSQIPVSAWYEIIGGEGTIADAILDRIVNLSHRIDLKGESLRKGILKQE